MAKLVVRLYGRFVFATPGDPVDGPTITAIAPRFHSPLCPHHTFLCIPRDAVALGKDSAGVALTDLAPDLKVVSDTPEIFKAEMFIWSLDEQNVQFVPDPRRGEAPRASLRRAQPDRVIPNLAVLVEQIGEAPAVLDRAALTASSDGKAQAVIHISEGVGLAKQVSGSDNAYLVERGLAATFARPTATERRQLVSTTYNRRIDGEFVPFKKADLVEFEIEIGRLEPFTFTLTTAGSGAVQRISVMAEQSTDVIYVNISHLCSTLPRDETYDLEFGEYYNLLEQNPGDKALILLPTDDGGEDGDCYGFAQIRYEK